MSAAYEALAVLASPGVLYVLLQLRGMAPVQIPDPSMHTTFIIDPSDIFARYQALFEPSSGMREAARVGFLVPARVSYLLFGPVTGFFAFRYLLALCAIVPLYLLLKRLYGRWAGFIGIVVVMSSPVVVTAWGTDYPDSAAVSYLTGGLAALALGLGDRTRGGVAPCNRHRGYRAIGDLLEASARTVQFRLADSEIGNRPIECVCATRQSLRKLELGSL
jgi:hypothetical protein